MLLLCGVSELVRGCLVAEKPCKEMASNRQHCICKDRFQDQIFGIVKILVLKSASYEADAFFTHVKGAFKSTANAATLHMMPMFLSSQFTLLLR